MRVFFFLLLRLSMCNRVCVCVRLGIHKCFFIYTQEMSDLMSARNLWSKNVN